MDAPASELDRALEAKTVRDPAARAVLLATVRELGKDGGEFTIARLQGLLRVEEHFQALLLYDQIDFLRQPATAEGEREFALNIQRICLESANGFQRFLRNRHAWASTPDALDEMFRVTGLAVNAIHSFVKWGWFLNEPGRTVPWKQIHALYLLAETDGYALTPFALHPARETYRPTVQSLYLRTLILDMLNTGNLTKLQVEIADGWFSSWCEEYSIDPHYSPDHHMFCVDVSSDSGMQLVRKDSLGETMRYVRADRMKGQIDEVQAGLRSGRLFAGHGAGAVFPIEEHAALLAIIEKLYQSVLAGSENRIEERTHFEDREVDATVGIERLLRKSREQPLAPAAAAAPASGGSDTIELSPTGVTLQSIAAAQPVDSGPADPEVERWKVKDLSSKGYGLLVDRVSADNVPLNGIIGLRNHESGGWIVGTVVRKHASRSRSEILVGVEVLSYRPVPVQLLGGDGGSGGPALYLPGRDPNGKQDAILVRAADFRSDHRHVVQAGSANYHVRLNRVIRKGPDWISARFEIEKKA
ncbi:MAG TPA: hypothetical protein VLH12_02545 [Usitatibacter sp.]|nr:hypothetical protein [Usitatibacter sp.]